MDKVLLVPDEKGEINKVLYGVEIKKYAIGLSTDMNVRTGRPSINLEYPESELGRVLAIADYMAEHGILPRVHYAHTSSGVYIAVIFQVENIERSFIENWFSTSMLSIPISKKVELIMTGEFETTDESFQLFMDYYHELGYFYVCLMQSGEEDGKCDVFWESKLTTIRPGVAGLEDL
jgi:hypothetical protein